MLWLPDLLTLLIFLVSFPQKCLTVSFYHWTNTVHNFFACLPAFFQALFFCRKPLRRILTKFQRFTKHCMIIRHNRHLLTIFVNNAYFITVTEKILNSFLISLNIIRNIVHCNHIIHKINSCGVFILTAFHKIRHTSHISDDN